MGDVNVVFHLVLLLGLYVGNASTATGVQTSDPPEAAVEQPERSVEDGSAVAIVLVPDSTGTRFVAPVQNVYGHRPDPARRLDRGPQSASVLESADWAGQGRNTAEILGHAAGLSVSSTGGLGASASVSLRGSSAAQVPVYLDGILVNRPDAAGANVGALNPQSVERIEVYRGGAPLTLGGSSMGGAIHVYTGSEAGTLLGSVTARSFGGLIFEGGGAQEAGAWTLSLRARALRADNDWEFRDDRGTIYNPDDDRTARRINNDVRGGGGIATARRPWGPGELSLSAVTDASEQGLPGYSVRQSETARGSSLMAQGQARWTTGRGSGTRWREAALYSRVDRQGYTDLEGDLRGRAHDRTDQVVTVGSALAGALTPDGDPAWRLELSHAIQHSEDRALSDGDAPRRTRTRAAAGLEPAAHLFGDRLRLVPGVRLERDFDDERSGPSSTVDAVTLQFGARFSLHPTLLLKGNIGHYERVPGLFELYGDRGAVVGNPALTPESGVNRDLGMVFSSGGGRVALNWFVNDAFDLILPVQISPVSVKYQNLARADIEGIELEADSGRRGPFRARLALTRMWTTDRSGRSYAEGHPLPGRPGLVVDAELSAVAAGWTAGLDFAALDENFAQTGGRAPIPARSIFGASVERSLGPGWAVLARVDNLGDEEIFDLYGYPLPGRQLSISIQKVR